jgi:hypothetical protein
MFQSLEQARGALDLPRKTGKILVPKPAERERMHKPISFKNKKLRDFK